VIGASERPASLGRLMMENLSGFDGTLFPVNPRYHEILGIRAYPDVSSLPATPDLAIIATPASGVPPIVHGLAARGTGGAVIISAGFEGAAKAALCEEISSVAGPGRLRIVGPNTIGVIVPRIGLNASFAHSMPRPGGIAFVAQSGAIATSVIDWAAARGLGFSHVVSLGDMADVDFGDLLGYLAADAQTTAILLYVEAITRPERFMAAARAAARGKPVLAVKGGRHARSAGAAASHTGRLAGPDAEYSAAFRRAGIVRVASLEELLDAAETLALGRAPAGRRLAIVSNGGGLAVLAADALLDAGGELATLGAATIQRLGGVLPAAWSHGNPIDIVGDATGERFKRVLEVVLSDAVADGVLVLHCPTGVSDGSDAASAIAEIAAAHPTATLVTSWLGEQSARPARALLQSAGVPTYETPERAVRGFMEMVEHRENRARLLDPEPETIPSPAARPAARAAFETARAEMREWLTQSEARAVLAAYGIPTTQVAEVTTPQEAGAAAARLGGSIALKIAAPDIVHKSEVGGVVLNLVGGPAVEAAAADMLSRVHEARPGTAVRGFTVECMVARGTGLELIIGATTGGDFGPVVLFGEGGTAVEAIGDTALELPPIDERLARQLISRTRVYKRMLGYRNVAAVDVDAVGRVIVKVSNLLRDFPQVLEIDINPLLATSAGCSAVDVRIRAAATTCAHGFRAVDRHAEAVTAALA
jgi:acetyltransferase